MLFLASDTTESLKFVVPNRECHRFTAAQVDALDSLNKRHGCVKYLVVRCLLQSAFTSVVGPSKVPSDRAIAILHHPDVEGQRQEK
jgi:hypothetical protein